MTEDKNFAGQAVPSIIDTEYRHCNFMQKESHTRIFLDDNTARTFVKCNLANCDLPPGSTITQCLHGHSVRDSANDDYVEVDGQRARVAEAFVWMKGA